MRGNRMRLWSRARIRTDGRTDGLMLPVCRTWGWYWHRRRTIAQQLRAHLPLAQQGRSCAVVVRKCRVGRPYSTAQLLTSTRGPVPCTDRIQRCRPFKCTCCRTMVAPLLVKHLAHSACARVGAAASATMAGLCFRGIGSEKVAARKPASARLLLPRLHAHHGS